jgi:hypothetical protein
VKEREIDTQSCWKHQGDISSLKLILQMHARRLHGTIIGTVEMGWFGNKSPFILYDPVDNLFSPPVKDRAQLLALDLHL